jgi:transposase
MSCYEAGRDGFWVHRALTARGITNYVVDSASIEGNRRGRQAKSDRLDTAALLAKLGRFVGGERGVWSVVHVPRIEDEDRRQLHRELFTITRARTRVINRHQRLARAARRRARHPARSACHHPRLPALAGWNGAPLRPRRTRGCCGSGTV